MKNCSKQPTYYEEKVLANYLTSFIFEGEKQLWKVAPCKTVILVTFSSYYTIMLKVINFYVIVPFIAAALHQLEIH